MQAARPFGDAFEHLMDRGRKGLVLEQHFGVTDDRGQGCAKLVRGDADEIRLGLVEAFEVAVGFVEGAVGLAQFRVELDQVLDETGVFERDRRLVGESRKGHQIILGITVAADLCAKGKQPDPFPFAEDGKIHFRFQMVEPLPLRRRHGSKNRKQVQVILQERALVQHQLLYDGMIAPQRKGFDLPFSLVAHPAQAIGFLRIAGQLRIDQEQEAARDVHRLDDESHGHIRQPLHIENVTDLFAIGMQSAARMELLDVQPAIDPAPDERKAEV